MPGTGAQGYLGIAFETTPGTYEEPTTFVPVTSESLQYQQETNWRRPIRASADIVGANPGNAHVEGDISMECFENVLALMLQAGRNTIVQTGTSPNFVYTIKGSAFAVPSKTLSITTVRNGVVFGYTGCVISSFTLTVDDSGTLMFNPSILGQTEAVQDVPTPTWDSDIQSVPFGAGQYNLQIPTSTQVFDTDSFELTIDDSGTPNFRLKDTPGAQFISYGERSVTLSVNRDFDTRSEYDAFKALTSKEVTLKASKGTNNYVQAKILSSIVDTYEVALSGQGDLTRATVAYNGVLDSAGDAYELTIGCQEDLGLDT